MIVQKEVKVLLFKLNNKALLSFEAELLPPFRLFQIIKSLRETRFLVIWNNLNGKVAVILG